MNLILSIDWDHTFRNTEGLDLQILGLVCYAQAKNIPWGLTTHRDIENTTLYAFDSDQNTVDALATTIYYWQQHILKPFGLQANFINARYQPLYVDSNYYQQIVLPHEKQLTADIVEQTILQNPQAMREKLRYYVTIREPILTNNEFKQAQLKWLNDHYAHTPSTIIFHIDDHEPLCRYWQTANDPYLQAIHYATTPLFSNASASLLAEKIGLLADLAWFIQTLTTAAAFQENPRLCLALCLFAMQIHANNPTILSALEKIILSLSLTLTDDLQALAKFIHYILQLTQTNQQAILLIENNLQFLKEESLA
jgi:hypothetical protein